MRPSPGHAPWGPGDGAQTQSWRADGTEPQDAPVWGRPASNSGHGVAESPWQAPEYGPATGQTPAWQSSFGQAPSQTAPRGTRLGAALLDGLILGVPTMALVFIALSMMVAAVPSTTPSAQRADLTGLLIVVVSLTAWLLPMIGSLVYFGYFEGMRGASLGKRMCGLKVVHAGTGEPIGFWQAVVRRVVLDLAASVLLLGYLSIFFDSSGQDRGWHDMAADSRVVKA